MFVLIFVKLRETCAKFGPKSMEKLILKINKFASFDPISINWSDKVTFRAVRGQLKNNVMLFGMFGHSKHIIFHEIF